MEGSVVHLKKVVELKKKYKVGPLLPLSILYISI